MTFAIHNIEAKNPMTIIVDWEATDHRYPSWGDGWMPCLTGWSI
jgi:hypothetical protein